MKRALALGVATLLLGACAGDRNPPTDAVAASEGRTLAESGAGDSHEGGGHGGSSKKKSSPSTERPQTREAATTKTVDPRTGGFEIALGEWAVSPETDAIRPGEVTFLIHNRGTMPHGFEIELEGESSGSGSGDLFKAESELLQPGESTRMTVNLTMTGIYKIECLVDGHDDMGMEGPLEVRADAPLKTEETNAPKASVAEGGDTALSISDFAFDPSTIEVESGTKVTWTNDDPAPHTVTSGSNDFDSDILDPGKSFSYTFEKAGTYTYLCNVHPDMKGTVEVR